MSGVRIEENVVVARRGDRDLKVDVFRPVDGSGSVPDVLFYIVDAMELFISRCVVAARVVGAS